MQALKNIFFFVAIFAVIICLLAFVPIDVLLNGILVMCALVFLVYIVVEGREENKQAKAKEAFYKKLCE